MPEPNYSTWRESFGESAFAVTVDHFHIHGEHFDSEEMADAAAQHMVRFWGLEPIKETTDERI